MPPTQTLTEIMNMRLSILAVFLALPLTFAVAGCSQDTHCKPGDAACKATVCTKDADGDCICHVCTCCDVNCDNAACRVKKGH